MTDNYMDILTWTPTYFLCECPLASTHYTRRPGLLSLNFALFPFTYLCHGHMTSWTEYFSLNYFIQLDLIFRDVLK